MPIIPALEGKLRQEEGGREKGERERRKKGRKEERKKEGDNAHIHKDKVVKNHSPDRDRSR
jgi:hypothetical protein